MHFVLVRQKNKAIFNQATSVIFANSYKLLLETPGGISEKVPNCFATLEDILQKPVLSTGPQEPHCFIKTLSTLLAVHNGSVIFVPFFEKYRSNQMQ